MKVTQELIDIKLNELATRRAAFIQDNDLNRQNQAFRLEVDLSVERPRNNPLAVDYPFKSVRVEEATDSTCVAWMRATSREDHQTPFRLGHKDGWNIDYHIPRAYLHWDAQPGKKMVLVFFLDSHFISGSQISVTSGGVSISDGEACATPDAVTLVANTAAEILPSKSNRKCATVENKTGADLFVGGATVSNTGLSEGITVQAGQTFEWRNTGALYGFSVPGGKVSALEEF